MQSRFINFTRNLDLPSAGGASVTWQACFPAGPGLKLNAGQLETARGPSGRNHSQAAPRESWFGSNTYLNLYYQNGFFNDVKPQPGAWTSSRRATKRRSQAGICSPILATAAWSV